MAYVERQVQDPRNFDGYEADRAREQQHGRRHEPRNEARDQGLRTIERHADGMDSGRPEDSNG